MPIFYKKTCLPSLKDSAYFANSPVLKSSITIINSSGDTLDENLFKINFLQSKISILNSLIDSSICVYYKPLPSFLSNNYSLRPSSIIQSKYNLNFENLKNRQNNKIELPNNNSLQKTGSISRGVSLGNNQSLIVNSNLDLQLNGNLSDDVKISAALSDQSIPFQPEGTTAQLQEFDQVYVKMEAPFGNLTLGDFQITQANNDYFLKVYKKAQGAMATTAITNNKKSLNVGASFAVARGKFSRNLFNGIEGNQGPYRLTGSNGELFIILIAGTERVYINGIELERGEQNDYTIDYNLGEITFTTKKIITQYDRIVVEFQYADNSYQRSIAHIFLGEKRNKFWWRANYYVESDNRNRAFFTELSEEDKETLALAGDSSSLALKLAIDTVFTSDNPIRYLQKDTLYNGVFYQNILQQTNNQELGKYRVTFSYVGTGKGDYVQGTNMVNGRVYEWSAPDASGNSTGDYAPYVQLISPIKQEISTFAIGAKLGKYSQIKTEIARSVYDKNSFSSLDADDNIGFGNKTTFSTSKYLAEDTLKAWQAYHLSSYEYVSSNFNGIERFRDVEFDRNWNNTLNNENLSTGAQHNIIATVGLQKNQLHNINYQFASLLSDSIFEGYKHQISASSQYKRNQISATVSQTDVERIRDAFAYQNSFTYLNTSFSKNMDLISIAAEYNEELNNFKLKSQDSLLNSSNQFKSIGAYISQGDSINNEFIIGYTRRNNYLPYEGKLSTASISNDFVSSIGFIKNPKKQLKWTLNYRTIEPNQNVDSTTEAENTLLNRIEYNLKLIKGALITNSYYQIGTGRERQVEIVYLKVPQGSGNYVWFDLNGDGAEDLGEFRPQEYNGQGNYLRSFINNNNYINAIATEFNQNIIFQPAAIWRSKKGVLGRLAKFSTQSTASITNKTRDENNVNQYNPFRLKVEDISLIASSSHLRQSIFYNRLSSKSSFEYTYINSLNKSIYTYGLESFSSTYHTIKPRLSINKLWSFLPTFELGTKNSRSEGFEDKNYSIPYQKSELNAQYQLESKFRVSFLYEYHEAYNSYKQATDSLISNKFGINSTYSVANKGAITLALNYYKIQFNTEQNTAVGFAMLNGLKKGNNVTWQLGINYQLSTKAILTIGYEGRKSESNKTIHTGTMNARWMF